jgi:uncharacterized protein (DUF433 family)
MEVSKMLKIADRIVIDPEICFGKPVIEGTRIPVYIILDLLGEGLTPREIIEKCYPHLKEEDILACIRYANSLIKNEDIYV